MGREPGVHAVSWRSVGQWTHGCAQLWRCSCRQLWTILLCKTLCLGYGVGAWGRNRTAPSTIHARAKSFFAAEIRCCQALFDVNRRIQVEPKVLDGLRTGCEVNPGCQCVRIAQHLTVTFNDEPHRLIHFERTIRPTFPGPFLVFFLLFSHKVHRFLDVS